MPVYLLLSAAQVMVRACDHRFQQFTYRQAILRGLAVALAQHLVSRRIAFVQPRIQAFQSRAHRRREVFLIPSSDLIISFVFLCQSFFQSLLLIPPHGDFSG